MFREPFGIQAGEDFCFFTVQPDRNRRDQTLPHKALVAEFERNTPSSFLQN
jgi:hypothetical protein